MKFHSILAFCGISTLAAVYYCYYQYITGQKRKQTSANRFLTSIKQETQSETQNISSADKSISNCSSDKSDKNNKNSNKLPNPTPDIITDHLTTVVSKESTKRKHDGAIYDRGCEQNSIEEDLVVVKEVETVCCSYLPLSSSASLQKTTSNNKSCSTGTKQATACEPELKAATANTAEEKLIAVQTSITQSQFSTNSTATITPGQCTVESDTPIASSDIVCELNTPSFSFIAQNKTHAAINGSQDQQSLDVTAIKTIKEQETSNGGKMCDEVVSNPRKTSTDKQAKGNSQISAADCISKHDSPGDKTDDLTNGYISWASIVEESLKDHSDPVLSSDPQTDTPYVFSTSTATTNQFKTSPSSDNKSSNHNRSAHAADSSKSNPNKKLNKGAGNTYQKPQNNTGSSQGHHSMATSDGRKMPAKNKQQHFSTSHYYATNNKESAYKSTVTADSCNKQSPNSVSANDKTRHSPNSKSHNVNSSPSKNNSSSKNSQHSSSQKANNRPTNNAESNNRNTTSYKNSLLSVDCNEANLNNNQMNKSSTPDSNNLKPTPTSKSPTGNRSNQENDPTGNALRAKGDKKCGVEKKDAAMKNTNVDVCSKQIQHLNGSSLDQIYLNDPSVISVISPSNYSEAG